VRWAVPTSHDCLWSRESSYIYGPGDLPVEQINTSTGTVTYLHHDQQGSTRLLTGSTGTVTGKCTYSAYGTPTCEGTSTTPLGYDGQYTSSDTGLIYLRARNYDPATGQFLSVDPLAPITGAPYNYAGDNPLNESDPTGLWFGIELPSPTEAAEAVAGWGDKLTFGATKWAREQLGDENVNTCSGAYQAGGYAGLATAVLIPGEDDAEAADESANLAKEITTRGSLGADGATSQTIRESLDGETISVTHRVELAGEVIHQHQTHIGSAGTERMFPDEWIEYPTIGE
jgi:RHS repeat-associated protein